MRIRLNKSQIKLLYIIIFSALIFVSVFISDGLFGMNFWIKVALLTVAYISLGAGVFKDAGRNIIRGKIFDENFLMCIATIGAYVLGDYTEAVGVMLFYQIGEFFQSYAVAKSRKSIKALVDICPEYANIERDGELVEVMPGEVSVGDIIVIKPGERVPLDGVVIAGASSLDMASLTGESMPADVTVDDEVLSGSINIQSVLKLRVVKTFENSTVTKILELMENASFNKANSEKFITRFARVYTPAVVICAVLTAFVPSIFFGFSDHFMIWLERALIFLVISCPCALVISVPMSFFAALGCASKYGILIKGSSYLEALGNVGCIVFDKTGTLTEGNFRIDSIYSYDCTENELADLVAAAEYYSDHPVSNAIKDKYTPDAYDDITDFNNIPGLGVSCVYKSQKILAGNSRLMEENNIAYENPKGTGTAIHVVAGGDYKGYILISDILKNDVFDTIQTLKNQGVKTCILSGDKSRNAESIAEKLGIDTVYSELLPQDKVAKLGEIMNNRESLRKTVAYVGDGINDAPVLSMADVGIAMGALGSDAAIEAADIIITDDKISKLITSIRICRRTNKIAKQNVIFALGVKFVIMVFGVLGLANMWAAVFADVGVAFIAILNSMRAFKI